jgi:hypothetical protein
MARFLGSRIDVEVKKRKLGWYVTVRMKPDVIRKKIFGLDQEEEARRWGREVKDELIEKYRGRLVSTEELRQSIELKGVTLKQAAKLCGISYASMLDYCSGLTPVWECKVKELVEEEPFVSSPEMERRKLLESLRKRIREFPKEWLPDIEGMIKRLERGRDGRPY